MTQDQKEQGGCCGGKKTIGAILIALIIFAVGFWAGKMSDCGSKICPISHTAPAPVQQ